MADFWLKATKTLRFHGHRALVTARGAWWDMRRPAADRPVFVVGCSRAGTTLVYKTFSESRELGSLQRETHDFWVAMHPLERKHWETHGLGREDASDADRDHVTRYFFAETGMRRFVDKNNQNGLCVSYLHALFPDARFVYVKRSPGDTINSLIEGWGKPDEFATWSDRLPEDVAVEDGRYRQWCFFLADGWREYARSSLEDVCAFQYSAINDAILSSRSEIPRNQWTELFYEDLVRDPVGGFRQAFADCGLAFTPEMERHCAGVLDKPYNAFSAIRLDKWHDSRHRKRIERVMPRVLPTARAMGYVL